MKKIPYQFIEKVREAMEQECELVNCSECIFFENGRCDDFSSIVLRMEDDIRENNKLMQAKQ